MGKTRKKRKREKTKTRKRKRKKKKMKESEGPTPPEDGRVCPERTLLDSCNVDCLGRMPNCTSTGETELFTAGEESADTFVTSWTVAEGAEGDTCRLYCPQSNNFDVTT